MSYVTLSVRFTKNLAAYPLSIDQEEILIAYFQSWLKKIRDMFSNSATILKFSFSMNKDIYKSIANAVKSKEQKYILFEKVSDSEYIFKIDESILKGLDLPMPNVMKRLMLRGSKDAWERIATRMRKDVYGTVALRMGITKDEIDIVEGREDAKAQ